MKNIKNYSDKELSLIVFNTEYLYQLRHNTIVLKELLDESFDYTTEQYETLLQDIEDNLNDNN